MGLSAVELISKLKGALWSHGTHLWWCEMVGMGLYPHNFPEVECTCGWAEVLTFLAEEADFMCPNCEVLTKLWADEEDSV